ncbi:hypothetical protein [Paraburkholderia youngii]|uniref:hypothetical protein n=1 Tax=Paraburkholderia youngii TaxID=2782701 RepID=UPI003D19766E
MNARTATPMLMGAVLLIASVALSIGILMLYRSIPDARIFLVYCVTAPLAVIGGFAAGWMFRTALPGKPPVPRKTERASAVRGRQ